jgi:hypothetical protein
MSEEPKCFVCGYVVEPIDLEALVLDDGIYLTMHPDCADDLRKLRAKHPASEAVV